MKDTKRSKTQIALFALRLFFYFSVLVLIPLHPGIKIPYDRMGIVLFFFVIPVMAFIAFLPERENFSRRKKTITASVSLLVLSLLSGGFSFNVFLPLLAGLLSYVLTFLLFYHPRLAKPSILEPFFLAWLCLRLLALSRSGEDIANQSMAITQFILVWTGVVFLFHSVVVYLCLFPNGSKGAGKEGALFFTGAAAALVALLVILPGDFVRNTMIENLQDERIPQKIEESSEKGVPREGKGRKDSRRTIPRRGDRQGKEQGGSLRGVHESEWKNKGKSRLGGEGSGSSRKRGDGSSSEDSRQYMVKIVISETEPVYMGDAFRGELDPVEGFLPSPQEPFNRIVNQRFFVSWFNSERNNDIGRRRREVISLSTMSEKFLPWWPVTIDPTILSEDSGPLRYIHQVTSNMHDGDPLMLVRRPSRPLNDYEKASLAPYLDLSLKADDADIFRAYMDKAIKSWQTDRNYNILHDEYFQFLYGYKAEVSEEPEAQGQPEVPQPVNEYLEKILALMISFSEFQYNLDYADDSSIEALKEFILDSTEGDCVEFSNTLALLGRMAGVPSRVVTGYLVSENLQTEAHLQGLANLRAKIPFLRKFPFDQLFMVTNLHGHSWTQFYIPDYGWLDFEATMFAIPPIGFGDFNTWDVVIPLIDENRVISQIRKFPWRAVLKAAAVLAVFALAGAYALRYGREAFLYAGAKQSGRKGARYLYLLLLARLAADGKPIKPASRTAHEYAELFPVKIDSKKSSHGGTGTRGREEGGRGEEHLRAFADLYSELRWREFADEAQREERFMLLWQEYREILKSGRRKGALGWFRRLISLRGLAYL
jgi:hypothetical protein